MLYDNIMIPYDGSASSKAALAEAVRFAKDDPGLTLRIVQIIDTDQLAIDKLEAEGRDEQTVASSAMLQKTYEEVTEEASKALHREIDPLLSGLMNKVYIELLQETQPGGQIVTYAIDNLCDLIVDVYKRQAQRRAPLSQVAGLPLRHHGRAARLSALLNLASAARRTKASFDLLRDRSPRDVVPLATDVYKRQKQHAVATNAATNTAAR